MTLSWGQLLCFVGSHRLITLDPQPEERDIITSLHTRCIDRYRSDVHDKHSLSWNVINKEIRSIPITDKVCVRPGCGYTDFRSHRAISILQNYALRLQDIATNFRNEKELARKKELMKEQAVVEDFKRAEAIRQRKLGTNVGGELSSAPSTGEVSIAPDKVGTVSIEK